MIRRLRLLPEVSSYFPYPTDGNGRRKLALLQHPSFISNPHPGRQSPPIISPFDSTTLADLINRGLRLSPGTLRRFWRTPALLPENVLFILRRFWEEDRLAGSSNKAQFCLDIFRWVEVKQEHGNEGFHHLPESYSVLASLLLRRRMVSAVESLLFDLEVETARRKSTARLYAAVYAEISGGVIKGYAEDGRIAKAVALYDNARSRGLPLSPCCYRSVLESLFQSEDGPAFVRVYLDAVRLRLSFDGNNDRISFLDFAVRSLCRDKRVLEAAELLRRARTLSMRPSVVTLDDMAEEYCQKQDFGDLLGFLKEWDHVPSALVCNKILSAVCLKSCVDEASAYLNHLECLGFEPDSKTLGILIEWSCRESKMREAFLHLSRIFERKLVPDVQTYNSLIAGIFMEGMWRYAKMVYADMLEVGVPPQAETFRVLLAGYCKERQFDLARMIHDDMIEHGMVSLATVDDAISKVFLVLGLDCLGIKIKRVSSTGFQEAEFYDSLGNGLYLDTDVDEYDKMLNKILVDAIVPNFDMAILSQCKQGNIDAALRLRKECISRGQNLSVDTSAALAKCLLSRSSCSRRIVNILDSAPALLNHLDHLDLNLIIQKFCNDGLLVKAKQVFGILRNRKLPVEAETFRALLIEFSNQRKQWDFMQFWRMARSDFVPEVTDITRIVTSLCRFGMLNDVMQLLQTMLSKFVDSVPEIFKSFLEVLCSMGHVKFGYELLKEFGQEDVYSDLIAFDPLIKSFSQEKMFPELVEMVDSLLNRRIALSTAICQEVLPLFCRLGNVDNAITLKQIMVVKQPESYLSMCKILISNLCKHGFMKEALIQLDEVIVKGLFLDKDILQSLMIGYCKESNWSKACEILNVILKMNMSLDLSSYRGLIHLFQRRGQLSDVIHVQNVFVKNVEIDLLPFYNVFIFYLLQNGFFSLVDIVFNEMCNKKLSPDEITYSFLLYGYSKSGIIGRSPEILSAMFKRGIKLNNRSSRIAMAYLCGNHMDATKVAGLVKIMDDWCLQLGCVTQTTLVERLLSKGNLEAAQLCLYKFSENMSIDVFSFEIIIKKLIVHGMLDTAIDIFNVMLEKGDFPSEASYNLVTKYLLLRKDHDQALDFLVEMQYYKLEPAEELCSALIYELCKNGRVDDAKMVLEDLLQSGKTIPQNHIRAVIDAYYAGNDISKASDLISKMQQNGHLPDFEMQWSLISNLSDSSNDSGLNSKTYMTNLLSGDGSSASGSRNSKSISRSYTTKL